MELFPLWGFEDSRKMVITRARTEEEAFEYASRSWSRGQTISPMSHLPIDAALRYSENHDHGWLFRMPKWILEEKGLSPVSPTNLAFAKAARKELRRIERIKRKKGQ